MYRHFVGDTKGWVEVKKSELARLGLLDFISSSSYVKNDNVYLDEDLDFSFFLYHLGNEPELIQVEVTDDYFNKYEKFKGEQ
tara:strand:+ start:1150 stop:1395 length:246 start_codon:yes stop_codon:yes gene_type:complete